MFPPSQETPVKCLKEIRVYSSKKVTWSIAQLLCLFSKAHSMGNKQEDLEAAVWLASYNLITITETWWNKSHYWSTAIDGYKMFIRDWQGRTHEEVALCKKIDWLHRATFEKQQWSDREFMGKNYRPGQQRKLCSWLFTTGCSFKGNLLTKLHTCRLWSCWETSTTLTSAGKAAQKDVNNPGDSGSATKIIS